MYGKVLASFDGHGSFACKVEYLIAIMYRRFTLYHKCVLISFWIDRNDDEVDSFYLLDFKDARNPYKYRFIACASMYSTYHPFFAPSCSPILSKVVRSTSYYQTLQKYYDTAYSGSLVNQIRILKNSNYSNIWNFRILTIKQISLQVFLMFDPLYNVFLAGNWKEDSQILFRTPHFQKR